MRGFVIGLTLALAGIAFAAEPKPNVIFVLSDDLAQGDVGCYGQKLIKTPNLDALAASVLAVLRVMVDPASYTPGTHDAGQPVAADAKMAITEVAKIHNLT